MNSTSTLSSDSSQSRPKIGLALGSGAARGWAHMGVLRALDELGIEIDVYAGCSAGALVSAAHLLGVKDEVAQWAKSVGPVSAMKRFAISIARGGLINPDRAFANFKDADRLIKDLPAPFGAVATDLATGKEVWLTEGSTLKACRASSAVPLVIQAASHYYEGEEHWLVDGALANPVPVTLARALGADVVIAVDLNAHSTTLNRFIRPKTRAIVPVEKPQPVNKDSLTAPVESFFRAQGQDIAQRIAMAKAKANASPQFFETALATMDIVQCQLAEARARADQPEIRLTPDLSIGTPAAFDQWQAFDTIGYESVMAQKEALRALSRVR